jgi:hypothetical protein
MECLAKASLVPLKWWPLLDPMVLVLLELIMV